MDTLQKLSRDQIDSNLQNNRYAMRVLQIASQHEGNLSARDKALGKLDTRFCEERASILGTRPAKDGDTHIHHRFNPAASYADDDIQRLHNIEVAQTLMANIDSPDNTFYKKMNHAIQGQKMHGAGATMATQLRHMREEALAEESESNGPKERVTVTLQL